MPKKIIFESAVYQFAAAARRLSDSLARTNVRQAKRVDEWIAGLTPVYPGQGGLLLRWSSPQPGEYLVLLKGARFYVRNRSVVAEPADRYIDDVAIANAEHFDDALRNVLTASRILEVED